MVANRLSITGLAWTEWFSMHNSGTYNNEWIIVDYNLFNTEDNNLAPNTVWILEQIPGDTESADVTSIVNKQGFWPSFNVPFFPYVFDMLGFQEAVEDDDECGQECSYTNCSRANIFRRDAPKVQTIHDMQHIMRYNEWKTDPLSGGDACNSIAARCDLSTSEPDASGALDAKLTSYELFSKMQARIIGGPTHQDQPVWVWSTSKWPDLMHYGEPDSWDFSWQLMDLANT